MSMKYSSFLIFLLLVACASATTPLDAKTMDSRVLIMNTVTFAPDGGRYRIDDATGMLSWFPRESRLQEVVSLETEPQATRTDTGINFHWSEPSQQETLSVTSVVRTKNAIVPVREKISFPLNDVPPDVAIYLEPGEITDQSRDIQVLAQQLAAGKDDAYEVVYTLADWTTRNVNYSLASVGQPAIQHSSQILASRYGKCDELTALFISMNRALGIPARFVGGYSYTTSSQFATNWGGHGWAEVWLPGQGWVPFDVTYGEYGYLDAGHIALKIAPDAKETSIDYISRGTDYELQTQPLDISVSPLRMTTEENTDLTITLSAPQRHVGIGSTVLILATVKNNQNYYVSSRLDLARSANTEMLSHNYENVLLKPGESKTIPFLVQIDSDLKHGYVYTFPFTVKSRLGPQGSIDIAVDEQAPVFDASAFSEEISRYTQSKVVLPWSITCDRGKVAYINEEIVHHCSLQGADSAKICDEKRLCSTVSGSFDLKSIDAKLGVFTRTYTATAKGATTKFFVTSRSVTPTVLSARLSAPKKVTPDDLFDSELNLSSTGAIPKDVNVTVSVHHANAAQHLDDLSIPARLTFSIPGNDLRPGLNNITAHITYRDEIGTPRTADYSTTIELTNVSFSDRVLFLADDAGYWLADLFE